MIRALLRRRLLLLPLLLLLCSVMLGPLAARAQPQTVTIAVDDAYAPYTHIEHEHAAGLYVRLMQRAMQSIPGWELKLLPRPWVRALLEAEQGQVDGVMPPYRGLGRDWIAFYAGPLYREEVVLSCRAASLLGPDSQWPGDFAGRHIGVTRGFLLSQSLAEAVQRKQVFKHEFRNARDALAALARGQIDCYANDRLSIELAHEQALLDSVWAARMPARLEPPYLLSEQLAFVGFSQQSLLKRPELLAFVKALDAQLAQLRGSGEMQRLIQEARRSAVK